MIRHHRDACVLCKIYVSFVKIIWLGILNTFRTIYFEEIVSFKYKIEELNLSFAI